jgi:hypothetical protein
MTNYDASQQMPIDANGQPLYPQTPPPYSQQGYQQQPAQYAPQPQYAQPPVNQQYQPQSAPQAAYPNFPNAQPTQPPYMPNGYAPQPQQPFTTRCFAMMQQDYSIKGIMAIDVVWLEHLIARYRAGDMLLIDVDQRTGAPSGMMKLGINAKYRPSQSGKSTHAVSLYEIKPRA